MGFRISLIAVTVLMSIFASTTSASLTASAIDPTETHVTPNPASIQIGKPITFKATVFDTSLTATAPTGSVSWSDGGAGGSFSSSTCTLTAVTTVSSDCTVIYTPSRLGSITITATFSGDSLHTGSSGTSSLTTTLRSSTTTVTPNPATTSIGQPIHFKVKVADSTAGIKSVPTGTVSWSDGGAGGSFSSSTCTLTAVTTVSSDCTVIYTPSRLGSITITATFSGDSLHTGSSGTSSLTSTLRSSTTTVTPNPATTSIGKPIIFKVKVADYVAGTRYLPTGTESWSDGGSGGSFSSNTCTLTALTTNVSYCTVTYTPSTTSTITITATFSGDSLHTGSSGTSSLTSTHRSSTTTVTPNSASGTVGNTIIFKVKVADYVAGTRYLPTGTVSWSDGGSGGSFSSSTCTLTAVTTNVSACAVGYTPSTTGTITITATYSGDSFHTGSSGTSTLTVT